MLVEAGEFCDFFLRPERLVVFGKQLPKKEVFQPSFFEVRAISFREGIVGKIFQFAKTNSMKADSYFGAEESGT